MRRNLDDLLAAWRQRHTPTDLSQLEPRVWAAIAATRAPDLAGLLGVRAALVAAMMIAGVAAGAGAAASAAPAEASPFALQSRYAPSTLLEIAP
ncbi:MAG: hypothetical protein K2P70_05360 [Hyphomonadaceae bacterium]|nr:hypothetical protein [Hyphomonadaceae bacterium]